MVETTRTTRRLPLWVDALAYWAPATPWRRAWAATRTLTDHGELVARWLAGEYRYTPGHVGPPDDETAAIRGDLIALNRAGLVSIGSQPGALGEDASGRWGQRAFLEAYGSSATVTRAARAAAAAGLWVLCDPYDVDGAATMPEPYVPVTFDLDTGRMFTGAGLSPARSDVWGQPGIAWHPESRAAWESADQIVVVDPIPGRERLLWDTLTAALAGAVDGETGR